MASVENDILFIRLGRVDSNNFCKKHKISGVFFTVQKHLWDAYLSLIKNKQNHTYTFMVDEKDHKCHTIYDMESFITTCAVKKKTSNSTASFDAPLVNELLSCWAADCAAREELSIAATQPNADAETPVGLTSAYSLAK